MKIEKLSDTQIRCTLNQADLSQRELKLSELAYGTEKAKLLFKDMMKQASYEFGFEAEDIPLMIEAIPISTDCIVLVVTKVEDPAELDTRFSRFAPSEDDDDFIDDFYDDEFDSDDMNDIFNHNFDYDDSIAGRMPFSTPDRFKPFDSPNVPDSNNILDDFYENSNIFKVFSFDSLETVGKIAHIINPIYSGTNYLYKNPANGRYLLLLSDTNSNVNDLNSICTVLTDYGKKEKYSRASDAFLKEHCKLIIENDAISVLDKVMS